MSLPTSSSSMYFPIPLTIETTAMRNITPMHTPSSGEEALELLHADGGEGQADGFEETHLDPTGVSG